MKKFLSLLFLVLIVLAISSNASAYFMVYDAYGDDSYHTPAGFSVIAERDPGAFLNPYNYYTWGINDVREADTINIVFQNIYNSLPWDGITHNAPGENYLTVALKDGGSIGFSFIHDGDNNPSIPNWVAMGYTVLGIWSDLDGPTTKNDVVFSLNSTSIISDGGTFTIGYDPDCIFKLDKIVVEANPPAVPEPATMFLLGSGLVGLGAVGRKKFLNKTKKA